MDITMEKMPKGQQNAAYQDDDLDPQHMANSGHGGGEHVVGIVSDLKPQLHRRSESTRSKKLEHNQGSANQHQAAGMKQGDVFSRSLGNFWQGVDRFYTSNKRGTVIIIKVLLHIALLFYLATAIYHGITVIQKQKECCDMQWCDGFGMLIIITSLFYLGFFYYKLFKPYLGKIVSKSILKPVQRSWNLLWIRRPVRIIVCLLILAAIILFLVLDTATNPERLISFLGLFVLLLLGFVFSKHPGQIRWRPVFWGLGIQFVFGLLTIRWVVGRSIFQCIGDKVATFLSYTDSGSSFVYGDFLVKTNPTFAFQVLPVIFFFCFIIQILYYYGVMQLVVMKLGWLLQVSLGTTVCESVNAAASVFLGMSEAPLLVQPYISDLTKSEIHAIMTGGFATVAGTVLAAYISFGVQPAHLITASVMSAPAALCYSKLFYPETEESRNKVDDLQLDKGDATGVLDAASKGAIAGIALVMGILANLIAFVSFVAFVNALLSWVGEQVGVEDLTFENVMAKVFIPLAWLMGVEYSQCENVARLVGLKTVVNEFVAYQKLGEMKAANLLTGRSEAIATYALCGFSNPSSIGILIGSLTTLAPSKRSEITEVAFRAFIAGSATCFMTACIAGMLMTEENFPAPLTTTETILKHIKLAKAPGNVANYNEDAAPLDLPSDGRTSKVEDLLRNALKMEFVWNLVPYCCVR